MEYIDFVKSMDKTEMIYRLLNMDKIKKFLNFKDELVMDKVFLLTI